MLRLVNVAVGDILASTITTGCVRRFTLGVRLLETASPPTFYVPPDDARTEFLETEAGTCALRVEG